MEKLWAEWKRVCKPGAPIVLFTQQPFTTTVAVSNLKQLKTELIWEKPQGTNFLNAKKYPMKVHENILVFCDQTPLYHPQMTTGATPYVTGAHYGSSNYRPMDYAGGKVNADGSRYPRSVLQFIPERGMHPTQKPVSLCEWLIRTYSNAGDTVLDCCMGSGTTILAALNTDRKGIGIEQDQKYFDIAAQRCKETEANQTTLTSIPHEPDIIEDRAA
ncbi:DNA-methyltransferase [Granulicella mallensis]|uniref:DNA-methyltransferase n=1 Tax=Granulicella mallensis TaxID=940614 RepID=UPI0037BF8B24